LANPKRTTKIGRYLKKIGYLDIRQMIIQPVKRKNLAGKIETMPGKMECFVYHGKHKMSGPFKSHQQAIDSANDMLNRNIKYSKNAKNR